MSDTDKNNEVLCQPWSKLLVALFFKFNCNMNWVGFTPSEWIKNITSTTPFEMDISLCNNKGGKIKFTFNKTVVRIHTAYRTYRNCSTEDVSKYITSLYKNIFDYGREEGIVSKNNSLSLITASNIFYSDEGFRYNIYLLEKWFSKFDMEVNLMTDLFTKKQLVPTKEEIEIIQILVSDCMFDIPKHAGDKCIYYNINNINRKILFKALVFYLLDCAEAEGVIAGGI